jgi:hypothetical protein
MGPIRSQEGRSGGFDADVLALEGDRGFVADVLGFGEQPAEDRGGYRVLFALVPQPYGEVAGAAVEAGEDELAECGAGEGGGSVVELAQALPLAPGVEGRELGADGAGVEGVDGGFKLGEQAAAELGDRALGDRAWGGVGRVGGGEGLREGGVRRAR